MKLDYPKTIMDPLTARVNMHEDICRELNALYERKNIDYGNSFGESFKTFGLAMPAIRIGDKFNRLKSFATKGVGVKPDDLEYLEVLLSDAARSSDETRRELLLHEVRERIAEIHKKSGMQVTDETLEDTLMDLANYTVMTLVELKFKKEGN